MLTIQVAEKVKRLSVAEIADDLPAFQHVYVLLDIWTIEKEKGALSSMSELETTGFDGDRTTTAECIQCQLQRGYVYVSEDS